MPNMKSLSFSFSKVIVKAKVENRQTDKQKDRQDKNNVIRSKVIKIDRTILYLGIFKSKCAL